MKYREVIKIIAKRENIKCKTVRAEMKKALQAANIDCSVREFIERTVVSMKDYI